jgi:FkbM family methyltransferase
MLHDIYNLLVAVARVRAMKNYPQQWRVWREYARIRVKNRWFQLTGQKRTTETFLGFKVRFFDYETFTYLFEEIFVQGTYSFQARQPRPLIVDAGSNIGISVIFLKWLYPAARIRAFEPDPRTFALLKENIEINKLDGVTLFNLALSDGPGEAEFRSEHQGSLVASLMSGRSAGAVQKVGTQSLSMYLDEPVDFMKMDIEGAESLCLNDVSRRGLLRGIHEMVIECHHNLPGRETILTEVLPVLEANGFRYQIQAWTQTPSLNYVSQDVILHAYQNGCSHESASEQVI